MPRPEVPPVWYPGYASQRQRCKCGKVLGFTFAHRLAVHQRRLAQHQLEHAQWRDQVDADHAGLADWERLNAPALRNLERLRELVAGSTLLSLALLLSLTSVSVTDGQKAIAAAASLLSLGLAWVRSRKRDTLFPANAVSRSRSPCPHTSP